MPTRHEAEREAGDREATIGPQSKIPLGLVISLIVAAATSAGFLMRIDARLGRMEKHMQEDWLRVDQAVWVKDLQMQNPQLKVPVVEIGIKQP